MARKVRLNDEREKAPPATEGPARIQNITINSTSIPPLSPEAEISLRASIERAMVRAAASMENLPSISPQSLRGEQWTRFRDGLRTMQQNLPSGRQAAAGFQSLGRALRRSQGTPEMLDLSGIRIVRERINGGLNANSEVNIGQTDREQFIRAMADSISETSRAHMLTRYGIDLSRRETPPEEE